MPNQRKAGTTLLVIPVNTAQKTLIRSAAKADESTMAGWCRATLRNAARRSEAARKSSKVRAKK